MVTKAIALKISYIEQMLFVFSITRYYRLRHQVSYLVFWDVLIKISVLLMAEGHSSSESYS
jgi:hypothetical protein